jgi:predicted anti-sigma-YlaC factor YlaD
MGQISLETCDRIRELCSAAVDGELSQLEATRVQTHLARCADCAAFAAAASGSAAVVQTTPLEQIDLQFSLPGRRPALARKFQALAAVAALAVTVGLSSTLGTIGRSPAATGPGAAPVERAKPTYELRFPDQELRMLERSGRARTHTELAF